MASVVETTKRRNRFRTIRRVLMIGLFGVVVLIVIGAIFSPRPAPKAKTRSKLNPAPALVADLPKPQFSVPGGLYTNNVSVALSASTPSASIRYTVDGSEPTSGSRKYSEPIQIGGSTLLKAKVFGTGSSVSSTVSR